ncbi:PREDICTED: uncharacterized protein LOC107354828 [Acropora digitifera]|uniref:uncharacterized protein LOC107354828 n=1 Tax=Acropora digitifera TaxID=70779 RepID=UPI00077A7C43|nr:PREDICTED: uncharacterized protein LOC107354828 [Acropora digitifera]
MQSVAGVVVIPHRTTDTRCSAGKVAIAGVSVEDKKPSSPSKPSTEDKKKSSIQPGSGQQDEVKSNCAKPPTTNHLRDLFISLDKVPIVLSSSHTTPPVAPKSTRLIQDGDRYIFLVEDTRGTKVSSVPVGTPASATQGTDEGTETEGGNEEEGEEEADFSDGGSEASLEEVRQHHRIIKTQKQDDPDYLTLFEAHQRRLEDTGSPTQGQGWCE